MEFCFVSPVIPYNPQPILLPIPPIINKLTTDFKWQHLGYKRFNTPPPPYTPYPPLDISLYQ